MSFRHTSTFLSDPEQHRTFAHVVAQMSRHRVLSYGDFDCVPLLQDVLMMSTSFGYNLGFLICAEMYRSLAGDDPISEEDIRRWKVIREDRTVNGFLAEQRVPNWLRTLRTVDLSQIRCEGMPNGGVDIVARRREQELAIRSNHRILAQMSRDPRIRHDQSPEQILAWGSVEALSRNAHDLAALHAAFDEASAAIDEEGEFLKVGIATRVRHSIPAEHYRKTAWEAIDFQDEVSAFRSRLRPRLVAIAHKHGTRGQQEAFSPNLNPRLDGLNWNDWPRRLAISGSRAGMVIGGSASLFGAAFGGAAKGATLAKGVTGWKLLASAVPVLMASGAGAAGIGAGVMIAWYWLRISREEAATQYIHFVHHEIDLIKSDIMLAFRDDFARFYVTRTAERSIIEAHLLVTMWSEALNSFSAVIMSRSVQLGEQV